MGFIVDRYLIYEFNDKKTAQFVLDKINEMAEGYWQDQGYTVTNGELIGKKGGVDNPSAAHTISWAEIQKSPDGKFYFPSLSNDEKFKKGTQQLIDAGLPIVEKEFPAEWLQNDEL